MRRKVLLSLVAAILFVRFIPHAGEMYALYVYPVISKTVSRVLAGVFFSLDEWIVIIILLGMIMYPFWASDKSWRHKIAVEAETVIWVVVWFYLGWGMNYFRDSFFERADSGTSTGSVAKKQVEKGESKAAFMAFLNEYTDCLNGNYVNVSSVDERMVIKGVKERYREVPEYFGLTPPEDYQYPKDVAFNWLYSSVGVMGYMGPFADESHLNEQLLPVQYAFTYAHELAHLLSISSEAEANYWAYVVCTCSDDSKIRYSGYLGILPNVMRNAKSILTEEDYQAWEKKVDQRVMKDRKRIREFWQSQYSPLLVEVQQLMFNALLKSNRIEDGTENYDQVVRMIMWMKNPIAAHH